MLKYRFSDVVSGFQMPVKCYVNGKETWLRPTTEWQEMKDLSKKTTFKVDNNFYLNAAEVSGK